LKTNDKIFIKVNINTIIKSKNKTSNKRVIKAIIKTNKGDMRDTLPIFNTNLN